jgi:hypothetical protein
MPYRSPIIDDLNRLQRERPDWLFSDILKKRASETYLRRGEIEPFVTTLIPLAEDFEAHQSSALKDNPLALMKALADVLGSKSEVVKKYSPDQPRVPAGSPDGGQWTSIEGDEWPHSSTNQSNEPVLLAADINGFTKHGINQTINRNISPSEIADTLNNPIKIVPQKNGTIRYIGRNAVVVINPSGQVVTVWGQ